MFIAFIGAAPAFCSSVTGGVLLGEATGVPGMSIISGVARAGGLALGEGDGRIVIPGIGAIVG